MKSHFVIAALGVSLLVGLGAQAATRSSGRPLTYRQQLNGCMTQHMAASRTLSYNAAVNLCRAQLKADQTLAASNR